MSEENKMVVGRRKCSTARIRLTPGAGDITVNKKTINEYFGRETHRILIKSPFVVTETEGKYNVFANVKGGGETGQAGAIRHGITRALMLITPEFRGVLKKNGFVTRDPRMKERKKYGQKGARARFQFSKR
jgi:small subunit ribosomal protein S9